MTTDPTPPVSAAVPGDDAIKPILVGAGVGLLGGVAWAVIVGVTNYEVGWVAWGIGALIGWAMTKATAARSTELAIIGAVIAIVSLLVGKVLIQYFVTQPAVEQSLEESPEAVGSAAAWRLRGTGTFPPELQARLDSLTESDTVPDAMWEEMVAAGEAHAATLPPEERAQLAREYADAMKSRFSPWQQLAWGFSAWDLLWFGLAVSTVWRMLKPPVETRA